MSSIDGQQQKFVLLSDQELQQYLNAICSARNSAPLNTTQISALMEGLFNIPTDNACTLPTTIRSHDTLEYMRSTLEAVDFFTEFCIIMFAQGHGAAENNRNPPPKLGCVLSSRPGSEKQRLISTRLPLSMWNEKRRVRCALLRFQLFCELFHQPNDSSTNVSNWETQLVEQEFFWLRYEWWEVEEVKCIYQLIVFCLENTFSIDESLLSYPVIGDGIEERGLTQLRYFLEPSLDEDRRTPFGKSYVQRFMRNAFYGFSKSDPEDYNFFSKSRPLYRTHFATAGIVPTGTYRTISPQALLTRNSTSRRWEPSLYPGVQLEHLVDATLNPTPPKECYGLLPKEAKRFVRLIGWCFWDRNKIYDWLEFGKSFETFCLEAGGLD